LAPTVSVSSDVHQPLGTIEPERGRGRAGTIYDAHQAETAVIHRAWNGPSIVVVGTDQVQLAHIAVHPPEALLDPTGFVPYHLGVWLAPQLWGAHRALLVGAALACDALWFRRSRTRAFGC